ncbi:hypothetical protein [Streptomyces sp. NPDC090026]|uniref:hypothetical protein n=1 Tax=Streptomyces sp. NPDC090026 TaxID=3365923 RepID=UPI00380DDDAB
MLALLLLVRGADAGRIGQSAAVPQLLERRQSRPCRPVPGRGLRSVLLQPGKVLVPQAQQHLQGKDSRLVLSSAEELGGDGVLPQRHDGAVEVVQGDTRGPADRLGQAEQVLYEGAGRHLPGLRARHRQQMLDLVCVVEVLQGHPCPRVRSAAGGLPAGSGNPEDQPDLLAAADLRHDGCREETQRVEQRFQRGGLSGLGVAHEEGHQALEVAGVPDAAPLELEPLDHKRRAHWASLASDVLVHTGNDPQPYG